MAGFAVNLGHFLSRPKAKFALEVRRGYQETEFLKHLAALDELEPLCETRVLVWHTRTERVRLDLEEKLKEKGMTPSYHNFEV
jgi:galactosylgalactosylxylosylprotein 3-beta-glucuronosyltransferase 3